MKYKGRKSIRLKNYDYSSIGSYFITICTYKRKFIFGKIENCMMLLNKFGRIVEKEWKKTEIIRPYVKLDIFTIMPNHLHAIILFDNNPVGAYSNTPNDKNFNNVGAYGNTPKDKNFNNVGAYGNTPKGVYSNKPLQRLKSPSHTLGSVIRGFKSSTTKIINELRKISGIPIWQRNYYEHIIRNEKEYEIIYNYILDNPKMWQYDRENPFYIKKEIEAEKIIYKS